MSSNSAISSVAAWKRAVDDGARLVRAAVVDGVTVGDVGDAFRESDVKGKEDKAGGDGLEGGYAWRVALPGGKDGRERNRGLSTRRGSLVGRSESVLNGRGRSDENFCRILGR